MPKTIYSPRVEVVGRPEVDLAAMQDFLESADLPDHMVYAARGTDAERLVELSTRLCYLSFKSGRESKEFHKNIIESGHGSTLEHANWTLWIRGISRSLSHELVRHRAGFAYSQLSQRYVAEDDTAFVMPPAIQKLPVIDKDIWKADQVSSLDSYKYFVNHLEQTAPKRLSKRDKRKFAREAARASLPNATETMIAMTGNARAWRHFIEMRSAVYAEAEIRVLALAIFWRLRDEAPMLFGDYTVKNNGEVVTGNRKV